MGFFGASRRAPRIAALCAAALALSGSAALWGFTVDDALITARYAHHVATGHGYVFNRGGPSTDGVTPLGYVYLLAPFARGGALDALAAAKVIGAAMHALGAAFVGWAVAQLPGSRWKWAGPVLWLVSAPATAWSASGLETSFVAGLVAIGASLRLMGRVEPLGVGLLGLAAGLRPELMPLAAVLGAPRATAPSPVVEEDDIAPRPPPIGLDTFARLALVSAPFVVAASVRLLVFGRPGPLSAVAKPADPVLGLQYALVCAVAVGLVGIVAPRAVRAVPPYGRWLAVGVVVHALAVAFAGGDWMPVSRLFVPVLPVLALAVASLATVAKPVWTASRAALALAGELYIWAVVGHKLVRVQADREALIEQMRGPLADARVIAGLDVGWLGAAAPDATIVDLAGVTDPEIAALPGGHLEKKIPDGLLETRGTDALVLQLFREYPVADPWQNSVFARGIEIYVAGEKKLHDRFEPRFVSEGRLRYVVLRERGEDRP